MAIRQQFARGGEMNPFSAAQEPSMPRIDPETSSIPRIKEIAKQVWEREHGESGKPGSVGEPFNIERISNNFREGTPEESPSEFWKKKESIGKQTGKAGYDTSEMFGSKTVRPIDAGPALGEPGYVRPPGLVDVERNVHTETGEVVPSTATIRIEELQNYLDSKQHLQSPLSEEEYTTFKQQLDRAQALQAEEEARVKSPKFKSARKEMSKVDKLKEEQRVERERTALNDIDAKLRALQALGSKPEQPVVKLPRGFEFKETPEEKAARLERLRNPSARIIPPGISGRKR